MDFLLTCFSLSLFTTLITGLIYDRIERERERKDWIPYTLGRKNEDF
jgi:hypothetical protein